MMSISENIRRIREYTAANAELCRDGVHFVYDKRYGKSEHIEFIVMGINPGEPTVDENKRLEEIRLEETSEYDFRKAGGKEPAAAKRWRKKCELICGTPEIAGTEALFWSSRDVAELERHYRKFSESPHVKWCVPLNKELIEIHNPRAVIFVGLKFIREIGDLYGLRPAGEVVLFKKPGRTGRLIAPYRDGNGRPWIFMKHWSARLSSVEKQKMADYVASTCPATCRYESE